MDCTSNRLSYRQTGYFSSIVLDYLDESPNLKSFYEYPVSYEGLKAAAEARGKKNIDRKMLREQLVDQYEGVQLHPGVSVNIDSLKSDKTLTICTAHQPNIFTGPLYFIYKILHVIKIAEDLGKKFPDLHFVPVYYMGSEDADLDELGHIYLGEQKLIWTTQQKGAVGRMKIDDDFLKLIDIIDHQLQVLPKGKEIISLIRDSYKKGNTVGTSTLQFVNALFGEYGLVVLDPDNAAFKKALTDVFKDELLRQRSAGIVEESSNKLNEQYKVQANPREINLFYLADGMRERIVRNGDGWKVMGTDIRFNETALLKELGEHPERFSPNVILRGILQESILPNIAFVGGGGELAYWLQLKDLFAQYKTPFPVLLLRNSFLLVEKSLQQKIDKLGLPIEELFKSEQELLNKLVEQESGNKLKLNGTVTSAEQLYDAIKVQASSIDLTLGQHVDALRTSALRRLHELEKKMLRAEKRKFGDRQRQIHDLKQRLFPAGSLQERRENVLPYLAKWGIEFIEALYKESLILEQEFVVVREGRGWGQKAGRM